MIADYAVALRRVQPEGPYHLAGWSTGGIYAHALTAALERDGAQVATLAMFDAPLPSICDGVDLDDDARFLCDLVNFANCAFADSDARIDYDQLRTLPPAERFQFALVEARRFGIVPAGTPEEFIRRLVGVGEGNVRAIQSYRPQPTRCLAEIFLPVVKGGLSEIAQRNIDEEGDHGWTDAVGQSIGLHVVPGNHFTMLQGEGAVEIARILRALIDKATRTQAAGKPVSEIEQVSLPR
jgi:thioesterase domain-containing protein